MQPRLTSPVCIFYLITSLKDDDFQLLILWLFFIVVLYLFLLFLVITATTLTIHKLSLNHYSCVPNHSVRRGDKKLKGILDPLVPNSPFLYPLKPSENLKVFWCFSWVENGCTGNKWVKLAGQNKWIWLKSSTLACRLGVRGLKYFFGEDTTFACILFKEFNERSYVLQK